MDNGKKSSLQTQARYANKTKFILLAPTADSSAAADVVPDPVSSVYTIPRYKRNM